MEQTYWLLAVDDEPDILRTNRKYLEARGYKVDTAICAMDGLELLRQLIAACWFSHLVTSVLHDRRA